MALAGCTGLIGLICLVAGPFAGTTEWFAHHLHSTFGFESLGHFEHHFDWVTAIMGTLAGVGWNRAQLHALRQVTRSSQSRSDRARCKPLYEASLNKFYVDEFYEWLIRPADSRVWRSFATLSMPISWTGWPGASPRFPAGSAARCWPGIRTG